MNIKPSEVTNEMVAEHIFHWKWMRYYDMSYRSPDGPLRRTLCEPGTWLDNGDPEYVECDLSDAEQLSLDAHYHGPKFLSDPAADYTVLEYLRKTQNRAFADRFEDALLDLWEPRQKPHSGFCLSSRYEPGDYSKAACVALNLKGKIQ